MHFIDVNCMIGEWGLGNLKFKSVKGLLEEMERVNIEKAFVFHSRGWLYDPISGNQALISEIRESRALIPVMVLTSLVEQEFGGRNNIIDYMQKNSIGAVRLFPNDHSYTLELWNIDRLFSILNEARMPVLIDCRPMQGSIEPYFGKIYDVAKKYPQTPIVLLTTGYHRLRILYELFFCCSNLYVDTSTFISFRGIEDVVKHFGSERVVFGTRMPFIEAGVSVGRILYSTISPEDKENIASRNILRLLGNCRLHGSERGAGE